MKRIRTSFITHFFAGLGGGLMVVVVFWYFFEFTTIERIEMRQQLLKAENASTELRVNHIKATNTYLDGDDSLAMVYDRKADSFLVIFKYHYIKVDTLMAKIKFRK